MHNYFVCCVVHLTLTSCSGTSQTEAWPWDCSQPLRQWSVLDEEQCSCWWGTGFVFFFPFSLRCADATLHCDTGHQSKWIGWLSDMLRPIQQPPSHPRLFPFYAFSPFCPSLFPLRHFAPEYVNQEPSSISSAVWVLSASHSLPLSSSCPLCLYMKDVAVLSDSL